mmetsp:Transcript_15237/g.31926  ORF Transcript_15237/g.31926 Transcript_15237/m.31926 type:complete len:237 (-) Transcript_15237:739-1449(-)
MNDLHQPPLGLALLGVLVLVLFHVLVTLVLLRIRSPERPRLVVFRIHHEVLVVADQPSTAATRRAVASTPAPSSPAAARAAPGVGTSARRRRQARPCPCAAVAAESLASGRERWRQVDLGRVVTTAGDVAVGARRTLVEPTVGLRVRDGFAQRHAEVGLVLVDGQVDLRGACLCRRQPTPGPAFARHHEVHVRNEPRHRSGELEKALPRAVGHFEQLRTKELQSRALVGEARARFE